MAKKRKRIGAGGEGAAGRAPTSITGIVRKIHFSNLKFTAGKLEDDAGALISFAGPVFVKLDDFVTIHGSWQEKPPYGMQIAATSFEYAGGAAKIDVAGLAHYLAVCKDFPGLGPKKARVVAEHFGESFGAVIESNPQEVARIAGITLENAEKIQKAWLRGSARNATATKLAAMEFTAHQIDSIINALGNNAIGILEADPYVMIDHIEGFGFTRVDEMAGKMGIPKMHPGRIRAGINFRVQEQLDAGHTWTERVDLIDRANTLLILDDIESKAIISGQLYEMISGGLLVERESSEVPGAARLIGLPVMLKMESEIYTWLSTVSPAKAPGMPVKSECSDPDLNEDQRAAVNSALTRQITVITGGAGSGKTYAVNSIVQEHSNRGRDKIGLCAPTGKAARRIHEVVGRDASTIHRLLGFRGDSWEFDDKHKLDLDLLVVDEFSMVDVALAWRLFRAVDWSKTTVVLVGDHNQLPPIGPGNPLRDIIDRKIVTVCRLNQVVRQAGLLKRNSLEILSGVCPESSGLQEQTVGIGRASRKVMAPPWFVFGGLTEKEKVHSAILELFEHHIEKLGYDLLRDVQVLTPTHIGCIGGKELNIALQRLIQKKIFGIDIEPIESGRSPTLYSGDKVIQTKNDYKIGSDGLMNGTIGFIRDVLSDGTLVIDFEGEIIDVPKKDGKQRNIQLAYALTVHKMQGSEVPCAVVIVHKSHSFMQHQALVYTGVTRARNTAIIVGDNWGIRRAVSHRLVETRRTFLALAGRVWTPDAGQAGRQQERTLESGAIQRPRAEGALALDLTTGDPFGKPAATLFTEEWL